MKSMECSWNHWWIRANQSIWYTNTWEKPIARRTMCYDLALDSAHYHVQVLMICLNHSQWSLLQISRWLLWRVCSRPHVLWTKQILQTYCFLVCPLVIGESQQTEIESRQDGDGCCWGKQDYFWKDGRFVFVKLLFSDQLKDTSWSCCYWRSKFVWWQRSTFYHLHIVHRLYLFLNLVVFTMGGLCTC